MSTSLEHGPRGFLIGRRTLAFALAVVVAAGTMPAVGCSGGMQDGTGGTGSASGTSGAQGSSTDVQDLFTTIDLDRLEAMIEGTDGDFGQQFLYIGRRDCEDCEIFEPQFRTMVEENEVTAQRYAYYTDDDREGAEADRMYALLDKIGVDEVPCIVVLNAGNVVHKWNDPLSALDELRVYLQTGGLPSGADSMVPARTFDSVKSADVKLETSNLVVKNCLCKTFTVNVEGPNAEGVSAEEDDGVVVIRETEPAGGDADAVGGKRVVTLSVPNKKPLDAVKAEIGVGDINFTDVVLDVVDMSFENGNVLVDGVKFGRADFHGNAGSITVVEGSHADGGNLQLTLDEGDVQLTDYEDIEACKIALSAPQGGITFMGNARGSKYEQSGSNASVSVFAKNGSITVQ